MERRARECDYPTVVQGPGDLVVMESSSFDPVSSKLFNRWSYCRRRGGIYLPFEGEFSFAC